MTRHLAPNHPVLLGPTPAAGPATPPPGGFDAERGAIVAEGFRGGFSTLLLGIPGGMRNVSELSRFLNIPRPICQRLVGGIRRPGTPAELLLSIPGVEGLRQIVEAARSHGADAAAVAGAEQAVARYAELIDRHGGSQAKLNAAIRSGRDPGTRAGTDRRSDTETEHRRRLFESARALCDRWCECKFGVVVLALGADPSTVDHVGAYGHAGLNGGPQAAPLCTTHRLALGVTGPDATAAPMRDMRGNAPMHGRTPQAILEQFCTPPYPAVISSTRGPNMDQFVEFQPQPGGPGVDIVFGDRSSGGKHPRDDDPPLVNYALLADAPPRRIAMTVFLQRALARECVATAGCYVTGVRGTMATRMGRDGVAECVRPSERWFDRLSHRPAVEYLGPGLENAAVAGYPRMQELCEAVFAAGGPGGWNPADFIGFRVATEYPVWNTEYLLSLDFTPPENG